MCYRQVLPDTQANSSTPIPLDFPNNVVVVGQGRIPQPRPPSNQKAEKLNDWNGIGKSPLLFSGGSEIEPHNAPIPAMTTNTTQYLPPGHWSPPPLDVLPSCLRPIGSTCGSTGRRGANASLLPPLENEHSIEAQSAEQPPRRHASTAPSDVCVATRHGNRIFASRRAGGSNGKAGRMLWLGAATSGRSGKQQVTGIPVPIYNDITSISLQNL